MTFRNREDSLDNRYFTPSMLYKTPLVFALESCQHPHVLTLCFLIIFLLFVFSNLENQDGAGPDPLHYSQDHCQDYSQDPDQDLHQQWTISTRPGE